MATPSQLFDWQVRYLDIDLCCVYAQRRQSTHETAQVEASESSTWRHMWVVWLYLCLCTHETAQVEASESSMWRHMWVVWLYLGDRVQVSSILQQQLHDFDTILLTCNVQCCEPVLHTHTQTHTHTDTYTHTHTHTCTDTYTHASLHDAGSTHTVIHTDFMRFPSPSSYMVSL